MDCGELKFSGAYYRDYHCTLIIILQIGFVIPVFLTKKNLMLEEDRGDGGEGNDRKLEKKNQKNLNNFFILLNDFLL